MKRSIARDIITGPSANSRPEDLGLQFKEVKFGAYRELAQNLSQEELVELLIKEAYAFEQ